MALLLVLTFGLNAAENVPKVQRVRPGAPPPEYVRVQAVTQESIGSLTKLRGAAEIESSEMRIKADEIDYDRSRDYAEARGHVLFDHYVNGEHIEADHIEYDLANKTGKFYEVRGSSPAKLEARPGVLTTSSPFSFQGKWAERLENRYILHEGFITNCKLPRPWWILTGSAFDVIPGERAIAKNSFFKLRRIPIFYTPRFYKSLERAPRRSGFLTPNLTNSSRRGITLGAGYYWAINRSYDLMYRSQWFTSRGFAHNVDFRGKPTEQTDFNFLLYGVNDKGYLNPDGSRRPSEGGFLTKLTGRSELHSWRVRGEFNYLSSFEFRQAFTESFFEAIYSENHSLGHISKYWDTYAINIAASRIETFQWPTAQTFPYAFSNDNKLSLRRLPTFEFNSRDHQIADGALPVWVSWNTSYSFLRRHERAYETRQFVGRADAEPSILTAFSWKDFHLVPAFSIRETTYNSSFDTSGRLSGRNLFRHSREFSTELILPSLSRIFDNPPGFKGKRVKHVIEPRATYRYRGGIDTDVFRALVHFDETEILSNTSELDLSVTNRFYSKGADGNVSEILSWEIQQRRFFDPTFGGALIDGQRNVLMSSASLTGYAFLDAPRNYSPVISTIRTQLGGVGVEWRADYDPKRGRVVASNLSANARVKKDYFASISHNLVNSVPVTSDGTTLHGLSPRAHQLFGVFGYGQENRRGVNSGMLFVYDYTKQALLYNQAQVTYNTDCCGWSIQYRRIRRFGVADGYENQFRVAFNVANIGSFGTLRRQERMF